MDVVPERILEEILTSLLDERFPESHWATKESFVRRLESKGCVHHFTNRTWSTTPSLHVRIWQDGDYHKVLIAPFALIVSQSFILSLVVNQYLDRFTWRHDSILNFIAKSLQPVINVHSSFYADVNGFLIPSIITGENYRPDLLFLIQSKSLYVLELTVDLGSNLNNNAVRKKKNIWTWSNKWAEITDVWNL